MAIRNRSTHVFTELIILTEAAYAYEMARDFSRSSKNPTPAMGPANARWLEQSGKLFCLKGKNRTTAAAGRFCRRAQASLRTWRARWLAVEI
jgi:hypothetical protein